MQKLFAVVQSPTISSWDSLISNSTIQIKLLISLIQIITSGCQMIIRTLRDACGGRCRGRICLANCNATSVNRIRRAHDQAACDLVVCLKTHSSSSIISSRMSSSNFRLHFVAANLFCLCICFRLKLIQKVRIPNSITKFVYKNSNTKF